MKPLLAVLIATSLSANAWLVLRKEPLSSPARETSSAPAASSPAIDAVTIGDVPAHVFETQDLAAFRDQLRAAGADESMVRAILEGALRRRYREELAVARTEQLHAAWWRSAFAATSGEDAKRLQETVVAPLRDLMGRDPLDLADAEKRYDFLPPEKRRLLAEIALDYDELEQASGGRRTIDELKSESQAKRLLAQERRKDVLLALTPAERAEYEVRFEGAAPILSGRVATMNGTEQEFRVLKPLLEQYKEQARTLPKGEGFSAAYSELQQSMMDKLVATIGPDRALDYLWSGPGIYPEVLRLAQQFNLPRNTAGRLMQLAAETGARASALHRDSTILPEGKTAALKELQDSVRPMFDALVPEALRSKFPEQARVWFTMLGEGRYMGFMPSMDSTGSGTVVPISVTRPAVGRGISPPPRPTPTGR
jgi:hypothetical protein